MPTARKSHEQKTSAERERYFETTIRGETGPTVGEVDPTVDATGTTIATEREPTRTRIKPRKRKNHVADFFRQHWVGTINGIIGAVIVAVLGWALNQVYTLNREVGQIQVQVGANGKNLSDAKTEFQRFEDHIAQELDRTNDRLDRANHR